MQQAIGADAHVDEEAEGRAWLGLGLGLVGSGLGFGFGFGSGSAILGALALGEHQDEGDARVDLTEPQGQS